MARARILAVVACLGTGCAGAVDSTYVQPGYEAGDEGAVKRISIAASASDPMLAELAVQIAADFVKLRKDYLVYPPTAAGATMCEACQEREGVLVLRILEAFEEDEEATVRMAAELYRCHDGQLLWRSEGEAEVDTDDEDLAHLTEAYVRRMGPLARRFAAVLFVLTQELMQSLPNPTLSDDEVLERIELDAA